MIQPKINVGETIFTTMSRLSAQHNAVNLGQGFPDFPMDRQLIDLVHEAMQDGHNQYAPLPGVPALLRAIAAKVEFLYGASIDADTEVCITPGATYAIYTALTTVLQPGDEVIVFEPAYDSYIPNIKINGAIPVLIPLSFSEGGIDWDRLRKAISPRTRLIIINNPHNPTGMVLSAADMEILQEIVVSHNLLLLSDEVYEHLIFEGKRFESVLRFPELFKRSFITYSFGKVYNCTGWKTGYCIAPASLMKEFKKVHQYNVFCSFGPVQHALSVYLQNRNAYLGLPDFFQRKRDLLQAELEGSGLKPVPSYGSYFQIYDYSAVSQASELDFAKELTGKAGVSGIPVSAFYDDRRDQQLIRFCFAKRDETLREAGARLKAYF